MWAKRAPQGETVLVEPALEGYGLMPAKGGKNGLSDRDIGLAVRYMLSKLEPSGEGIADSMRFSERTGFIPVVQA